MRRAPLFALLLLMACGGGPPVQTDFNPNVDFAQYGSFAFGDTSIDAREGSSATDPRVMPAIHKTIRESFAAKSMTEAADGADLSVSILIALGEESGGGETGAYYWDARGGTEGGDSYVVKEGTLIIDFFDNATGQRVWRSRAHGPASRTGDPDLKGIAEIVAAMLAEYPPATGGS